jgi:hypothetical protein
MNERIISKKMNECELNDCSNKRTHGCFCKKHKEHYLLDENGMIINERFTSNISDYKVSSLKKTCENLQSNEKKHIRKLKKKDLFEYYLTILKYSSISPQELKKIINVQSILKNKIKERGLIKTHGPAYINRELCNNGEDFFTFEEIKDIPEKYFFSYKDEKDIIWGFDIRSLTELLKNGSDNPYTRVQFSGEVKKNINNLNYLLKKDNIQTSHEKVVIQDKSVLIHQKITDLFSRIEYSGLSCNQEWLTNISVYYLKKLYRTLEDIWNYRLQLTHQDKIRLCPPNGVNFNRIRNVLHIDSKDDILEIIIDDICKFERSQDINDKKLGYMYFLIGLGSFSRGCFETHYEWLSLMF